MAIGALDRCGLIEKDRFTVDYSRFPMTPVTGHSRMASGERKVRAGIVVKG
jgi:hypothetical protein